MCCCGFGFLLFLERILTFLPHFQQERFFSFCLLTDMECQAFRRTNRISLPISEPWSCVVSWLLRCDWLIWQKRKQFSMEFSLSPCALREHMCKTLAVKKNNRIYRYLKPRPPLYEVRSFSKVWTNSYVDRTKLRPLSFWWIIANSKRLSPSHNPVLSSVQMTEILATYCMSIRYMPIK